MIVRFLRKRKAVPLATIFVEVKAKKQKKNNFG